MKLIFYVVTIALFTMPSFSAVKYECNKQCVVITKGIADKPTGDLNCTLPNMPNLKIVAEDVFEVDGVTLKTYPWEAGRDVCDVLGWMDDGQKKFSELMPKVNPMVYNSDTIHLTFIESTSRLTGAFLVPTVLSGNAHQS